MVEPLQLPKYKLHLTPDSCQQPIWLSQNSEMNCTRSIILFFLNVFCCMGFFHLALLASPTDDIEELHFDDIGDSTELAFAKDTDGNTWVKHRIPSFSIAYTHVAADPFRPCFRL